MRHAVQKGFSKSKNQQIVVFLFTFGLGVAQGGHVGGKHFMNPSCIAHCTWIKGGDLKPLVLVFSERNILALILGSSVWHPAMLLLAFGSNFYQESKSKQVWIKAFWWLVIPRKCPTFSSYSYIFI